MGSFQFSKMSLFRKYQFWKNVTSEKWNSDTLNTFGHFLSSLLGVIATVFSNHSQKWRQKVFNVSEFHFSEVTFFQNWYFSRISFSLQFWILVRNEDFDLLHFFQPSSTGLLSSNWSKFTAFVFMVNSLKKYRCLKWPSHQYTTVGQKLGRHF